MLPQLWLRPVWVGGPEPGSNLNNSPRRKQQRTFDYGLGKRWYQGLAFTLLGTKTALGSCKKMPIGFRDTY